MNTIKNQSSNMTDAATPSPDRAAATSKMSRSSGGGGGTENEEAHTFSNINEHPVDDISLEFFYKPHRLTLLLCSVVAVMYCAFVR